MFISATGLVHYLVLIQPQLITNSTINEMWSVYCLYFTRISASHRLPLQRRRDEAKGSHKMVVLGTVMFFNVETF